MQVNFTEEQARHLIEILLMTYDEYVLERATIMAKMDRESDTKVFKKLSAQLNDLVDHIFILSWLLIKVGTPLKREHGLVQEMDDMMQGVVNFLQGDTFKRHRNLEEWLELRRSSLQGEKQSSAQSPTSVKKIRITISKPEQERDTQ
jgi:hypothetical protein